MRDSRVRFESVRDGQSPEEQRRVRETFGGLGVVQSESDGEVSRESGEVWGDVREVSGSERTIGRREEKVRESSQSYAKVREEILMHVK